MPPTENIGCTSVLSLKEILEFERKDGLICLTGKIFDIQERMGASKAKRADFSAYSFDTELIERKPA